MRSILAITALSIALAFALVVGGCAGTRLPDVPAPTEHRQDSDAERRHKLERRAWIERMHRTAPDTDWKAIEKDNRRLAQEQRNALGRTRGPAAGNWQEVGSSNLAGRMHAAAISSDGQKLYAGSSLGGVWRGNLDGTGWEPLGDNLYGGVHEVLAVPGENAGDPDVIVTATDDGSVHVSRDDGLIWETPTGATGLTWVRGVGLLDDASHTLLLFARGPSTSFRASILASTDYGRSFSVRWQGTDGWGGWMWIPRTGSGAVADVWVVDHGDILHSTDGGFTFPDVWTIDNTAAAAVLTGSEAGSPSLYAALLVGGGWKLYRSRNGGPTWSHVHDINDFWQSLTASTVDRNLLLYGGVEVFRSEDGGANFDRVNYWWEYYDDPANLLHADIPGLQVLPDPTVPGQERWYLSTDGGLYHSLDGVASVQNLSLQGLGVSQYYSTLSSRGNWDRLATGSQDQGYQLGTVQHGAGPTTPLEQLISGDYGHLTSGDGQHNLVYSTYPGFVLVQDGPSNPPLPMVDFPPTPSDWLPSVVADPLDPETFYFCGAQLYRFDRITSSAWSPTLHSSHPFGGAGVDGDYLTNIAFAPTDPDRVYAVNDHGHLYHSADHGVSWNESAGTGPTQHYFYGTAITVHPDDPLEVAVGGSGYSTPGVMRSTDGGQTWSPEITGLPTTLVYALVYAEDGSGDLYAGTETGAWRWNRQTGTWEDIVGNEAPTTIYWSAEVVNDGGTIRFGTYGRGAWDYSIIPNDRDGDGHEDASDICPNNDDALQLDDDGDGPGDACDNCPALFNADQLDTDLDNAGDACDCNGADSTVFAVPTEVDGVYWLSPDLMVWDSSIPAAGFSTEHVVRTGTLDQLPLGPATECASTVTRSASLSNPGIPPAGTAYWYLVQGSNSCGAGTLGTWGTGVERNTPTCN